MKEAAPVVGTLKDSRLIQSEAAVILQRPLLISSAAGPLREMHEATG